MIKLTNTTENYDLTMRIKEDTNEFSIIDSIYNFLISSGYDKDNISEAFMSIGDNYSNDDDLKDILADNFAKRITEDLENNVNLPTDNWFNVVGNDNPRRDEI